MTKGSLKKKQNFSFFVMFSKERGMKLTPFTGTCQTLPY